MVGGGPLPDSRWLLFAESSCGGRAGGALWGLSYKDSNPIVRAPHSRPNHPPEAQLLTPSFGGGVQHRDFEGTHT